MLLECPALYVQRKQYFSNVKSIVTNCIGISQREEKNNKREKMVHFILDCSKFQLLSDKPDYLTTAKATTEICDSLNL